MDDLLDWDAEKNASLKLRYGIGFEQVVVAIAEGGLIIEREHPNRQQYGHQRQFLVRIEDYVWIVPFVRNERGLFLKTLFPSRKATRAFRERADD